MKLGLEAKVPGLEKLKVTYSIVETQLSTCKVQRHDSTLRVRSQLVLPFDLIFEPGFPSMISSDSPADTVAQ
jgi:hypothetical protein